jgi:hypothetical protein
MTQVHAFLWASNNGYAFWSRQHAHLSHGHYPVVSISVWQLLLFGVRLDERLQAVDVVAAAVIAEPAPWTQSWH